jgi:gliding-associated putative ABC transporter substrate-binding component GldG
MSTTSGKRKAQQRQAGFRLLILVGILVLVNVLASRFHYGLDLTKEKRFTLSPSSKKLLRNMDDVAIIDVYLEGRDFPPGFQRLRDAVRERLQALKEYGGTHIMYRFTDPFAGKSDKEIGEVYQNFASKGMSAINVRQNTDERTSSQLVVPYLLVQYKEKTMPVNVLEPHLGMTPQEQLNYSESMLEYKIVSAINQINKPDKPRLAYITGNGEALGWATFDILHTLKNYYHVDTININDGTKISSVYSAAIVCKPGQAFDDKQKFKLDQYVMNGGKMLWLLDGTFATMDSFKNSEQFIAPEHNVNLGDMLFKYGVRVNADLIEDAQQSGSIYVQERMMNGQPNTVLRGWYYFPVFIPTSRHPIVNNMDAILGKFVSTIDTIGTPDIRKTILLESSQYSRPTMAPARVSLSILRYPPKPELFNKPFKPAAVLLEGKFQSAFADRIPADFRHFLDSIGQPFRPVAAQESKMIVIADGDMMLNEVSESRGPQELGYSLMERLRYANKSFILNCLEYLTDTSGILESRSKDVRLRLLDGGRVKNERTKWQAINIILPIALVLVFASAYLFFRKRRYENG